MHLLKPIDVHSRFGRTKGIAAIAAAATMLIGGCGGGSGGSAPRPATDRIVFQSDRDGASRLYQMNGDGTGAAVLTPTLPQAQEPAFSPDGRRVAFASRTGAGSTTSEIFVINLDGSGIRQLTTNAFVDDKPSWSPDGQTLAFRSTRPDVQNNQTFQNTDIYLIDADGTNERRLTTNAGLDRQPAFAPDGRVVFSQEVSGAGPGILRISRIRTDGTGLEVLSDGPSDIRPAVSPDGSRIAFVSNRDGDQELYVMDSAGNDETRITNSPGIDIGPAWSPDSRRLVFSSARSGNTELYVQTVGDSDATQLTDNNATDSSPDVH